MVLYVSTQGNDEWSGLRPSSQNGDGPFQTIERALSAMRSAVDTERIIVLREGVHYLQEPLVLSPDDSGLVISAHEGEQPVVSGGTRLDIQWQLTESVLWFAELGGDPGIWWFRDLYADGIRLPRSRYPKGKGDVTVRGIDEEDGLCTLSLEFSFACENLKGRDAELVTRNVWTQARSEIVQSHWNRASLRHRPGWLGHGVAEAVPGGRAFFEHAFEFVQDPGEWWLDRQNNRLVMAVADGEDPNEHTYTVPHIHQLLHLEGLKERPIRNVRFEGIAFHHAKWEMPSTGYSGIQAGHYGTRYMEEPTYALPLAIKLDYAENCTFEQCELAHTGASGIGLAAGCRGNSVTRSRFVDVGGNAIMVGYRPVFDKPPLRWSDANWEDPTDAPQDNEVSHNEVYECAAVHADCVGIFVAYSERTRVLHNHVHDLPYTGLSIGFIWSDIETSQRECEVAHNLIHDVMQVLWDGAAIYTLGAQPGSHVHHNLIHDVPFGHGIYTDEGSSYILIEDNVIYNIGKFGHFHHYGHHNVLRRNIYAHIGTGTLLGVEVKDKETGMTVENNIVYLSQGRLFGWNWPDHYVTVRNNLYWDPRGSVALETAATLAERQSRGIDLGSVFADPMFVDPMKLDFTLKPDSPGHKLLSGSTQDR